MTNPDDIAYLYLDLIDAMALKGHSPPHLRRLRESLDAVPAQPAVTNATLANERAH